MLGKKLAAIFGKKNRQSKQVTVAAEGASVNSFLLPVFLAAALMMVLVSGVGRWLILKHDQELLLQGLAATAGSVVQVVEAKLQSEKSMLSLLAQDVDLLNVLASQSDDLSVQNRLRQKLPAAVDFVVSPVNVDPDHLRSKLFNSYQAMELHEQALKTGSAPKVEALKLAKKNAFMIAVPVKQQEQVVGTLVARYNMDMIGKSLQQLQLGIGVIALDQLFEGNHFLLAASPGYKQDITNAALPVRGTLWQVRYGLTTSVALPDMYWLALLVMAALVVYLVVDRQRQKLANAIKADMGTAVSVVNAILKRTGTPVMQPQMKVSESALELLSQYAKATFTAAKVAGSGANKAGLHTQRGDSADDAEPVDKLPDEIFLANDIRGVAGETLTLSMAQQLGRAIGTSLLNVDENSVLVGHDARLSSAEFSSALIAGLLSSGCDVYDLGLVPVPLLYFATQVLSSKSCVMITGGHNPAAYNGFKIIVDGEPLVEDKLLELRDLLESDDLKTGTGHLHTRDISGEYIRQISSDVQLLEPRKVVIDAGNGAAGPLLVRLLRELGCEVLELYCDPDGEFPNHHPDPAQPENLSALALEVQAQAADFGVALDGDGDRLAIVDERGEKVATDMLIMLLAADIIRSHPGADVIYDVKSSSYLASYILSIGGRPVMWKTGHALMKIRMQQAGSLLGGEYAGHLYIKDRWFGYDDALYATARLLELFSAEVQPVSAFFAPLPKAVSTCALEMEFPREQAASLIQKLEQQMNTEDVDVVNLDGLRLEFNSGWALLRISNTLPRLVFRFEGRDEFALQNAQDRLRREIQAISPDLVLPF